MGEKYWMFSKVKNISCVGFLKNYITWMWHGELLDMLSMLNTWIHWSDNGQ